MHGEGNIQFYTLLTPCTFLQLVHQPTYALNKIHSQASIKLLHVLAPWCHHQGVIENKGVQDQQHLGIVSSVLKLLKY
jgi:hypothetical protein